MNKMGETKVEYVLVLGYGWSGSSAVVDLLREYDCTYQIPIEFRLIKDPHGLMDLRYNLVERWDQLNADIAIKDFLWLAHYLNQKKSIVPCKPGLGYGLSLGNDFISSTNEFLNNISPIRYKGYWWYFDFGVNGLKLFFDKVRRKLTNNNQLMYYSNISGELFDNYSKKYIDSIFRNHTNGKRFVILDQAVPAQNPFQAEHFFSEYKVIIVDRDPRDNFCDLINQHALMGDELRKNGASFFVDWFLRNRDNVSRFSTADNIMYLSFENLVMNYDESVRRIEDFIGLIPEQHTEKNKYFIPERSIRNIGIWKNYDNREVIKEIEIKLSYTVMKSDISVKKKSLKSNLIFSVMIKVVTYIIPLITAPYISRVLGPEGVGTYTYANSIVSYFALLVNFGFVGYGTQRISANRNDKEKYSGYFWSIVIVRGILFIIALSSYFILLFFILNVKDQIWIYLILSVSIFSNFFDITYLFQGLENFKIVSLTNCCIRVLAAVCLFVFVKSRNDVLPYVIIQTFQLFFISVLPWLYAKGAISRPDKKFIKIWDTLKTSFFYFLPTLAVTLCALIDSTMLGSIKGSEEVAFYEQPNKIISMVFGVLHAFAPVFFSRITILIKTKKEDEVKDNILSMFSLYYLIGFPSIFGLYAISNNFIPFFFGEEFIPSIIVIYFLAPLILIKSLSNAIGNVYYAPRDIIWMTSIFYTFGSVLNICMNSFLIPPNGAKGAAIASLVSESIVTMLFVFFSRKKVDYFAALKKAIKPLFAAIIMFSVMILCNLFLFSGWNEKIITIIDCLIGVMVYSVSIVLLRERMVLEEIKKIKCKLKKQKTI